ncbi:MAG: NAD(P)/FAD-dependent oxidoreductase [Bacteroidetes bacterium]|nr:NAD(P)/FAD-dependent oxidoreductase [Bacteroidota bacterium]
MQKYDIIVIGGGPAGLMAAGRAAELGAETILIEKNNRIGRKLSITGKGRCNITNSLELADFLKHFNNQGRFLRNSFSSFFSNDLIEFFNNLGLETVVERGGRVFPKSEKAVDVVDVLKKWCYRSGVEIKSNCEVKQLIINEEKLEGVKVFNKTDNRTNQFFAKTVIVATGGVSYPRTGSTGDGYRFAKSVGHKIIPVRPSLVPLEVEQGFCDKLNELNLKNVSVSVWVNNKKETEAFGELTFTDFGISGPTILSLSKTVVDALNKKNSVKINIDLKPALDNNKLDTRLIRELNNNGKNQFKDILKTLLPLKLIPVCSELTGIPTDKLCNQINSKDRKKLRIWLKDFSLDIKSARPISEAIITAGGVDLKEIDKKTLSSKLNYNLFFAGEVLDIDADTGGYNLQAAFSTGRLAGEEAVKNCKL